MPFLTLGLGMPLGGEIFFILIVIAFGFLGFGSNQERVGLTAIGVVIFIGAIIGGAYALHYFTPEAKQEWICDEKIVASSGEKLYRETGVEGSKCWDITVPEGSTLMIDTEKVAPFQGKVLDKGVFAVLPGPLRVAWVVINGAIVVQPTDQIYDERWCAILEIAQTNHWYTENRKPLDNWAQCPKVHKEDRGPYDLGIDTTISTGVFANNKNPLKR